MSAAACRYCETYDLYHTQFALHRLGGWDGNFKTAPHALTKAYTDMIDALGDFYEETMGRQRPNYVQIAQDMINMTEIGNE